jgi:hypothetical protein
MAKTTINPASTGATPIEVELKDPRLAAFLAWLVPGLGHLYQGRTGKGVLFLVCIVGTFVYGMWLGGGRVVYASAPSAFTRWQYFCQLGVGLPALPAVVERQRQKSGKGPLLSEWYRPPRMVPPADMPEGFTSTDESGNTVHHPDELAKWYHDYGDWFELGTVFTVIAGLLNVLAIYDAYGGPLIIPPHADKKKSDEKSVTDSGEAKS